MVTLPMQDSKTLISSVVLPNVSHLVLLDLLISKYKTIAGLQDRCGRPILYTFGQYTTDAYVSYVAYTCKTLKLLYICISITVRRLTWISQDSLQQFHIYNN